jgi:DNA-binding helix-hairpin-helix protein with protein kinase domain
MPKIADCKDIHHLYSPKSRRTVFLRADWRFLIRAATNIARAFRVVHEAGYIIGDVNHGSILVGQDATVRLIDCDSFQVTSGERCFLCEVGVETFTPPELQEKDFSRAVRTAHHDNFGLAVMVFLMLFMGRYPFAGRYLARIIQRMQADVA